MPSSSKWPHSLRFRHQNPEGTSPIPHACYLPSTSHYSSLYNPSNIWLSVQITKPLITQSSPLPFTSYLFRPEIILNTHSPTPSAIRLTQRDRRRSNNAKFTSVNLKIFTYPGRKLEKKIFCVESSEHSVRSISC
jgi:hypothetical protein